MLLLALLGCALIAAPASARHVACGDTIAQDTTLDSNLRDCPADGLLITANDVTIDFAGHTVDGTGNGKGVSAERHVNRFTLVGGTIKQFAVGVLSEMPRGLVRSMRILENAVYGVEAHRPGTEVRDSLVARNELGSDGPSPVTGSTFIGNREEAIRTGHEGARITDNTVRRNGTGIRVEETTGTVARNAVTDNAGIGIHWNFSSEGLIRDNLVARNGFGIVLESGQTADPVIEHNTVAHNRADGIRGQWDGPGSIIARNQIHRNGGSGIHATGLRPCPVIRSNKVSRNGGDGIFITELFVANLDGPSECDALPVTGNTASGNTADGIRVADNTMPVIVKRNRADHNGDDGIDVDAQGAWLTTPVWSADGQQIAFSAAPGSASLAAGPGLYVSDPDGSAPLRIAIGEHPDWAPGGQLIAFVNRTTHPGVYTVHPDGSGLTLVAPSSGRPAHPAWSPDGQTIVYDDSGTIYSVPAAGGTPQALTSVTPARNATWSPDGNRILFESRTSVLADGDLHIMNRDGGSLARLAEGRNPAWSPDGSQVVFARAGTLWITRADGTATFQLTTGTRHRAPSWSPDGAAIAFLGDGSGLFKIEMEENLVSKIVASNSLFSLSAPPDWSPDSARLVYEDSGRLRVVGQDGSGLMPLALLTNPLVTLTSNRADHNGNLGIEALAGALDGGGNRARRNGDPRQCVGVACR